MLYWSPNHRGFFDRSIHGASLPQDAVAISPEQHAALLHGQAVGQRIVTAEDGAPCLTDDPITPSDDERTRAARAERDRLLDSTDRWMWPDRPLTEDQRAAWARYRQALRDLPQQAGFPTAVEWPEAPS